MDHNIDKSQINKDLIKSIMDDIRTDNNDEFVSSFIGFIETYEGDIEKLLELTTAAVQFLLQQEDSMVKAKGYDRFVEIKEKHRPKIEDLEDELDSLNAQINADISVAPATNSE